MSQHVHTATSVRHQISVYVTGFGLCLLLTGAAYVFVTMRLLEPPALVAAVMVLAVVQLFVQLLFFLHLGHESKPRWNLISLLFALLVIVIVAGGSLWIMNNLNYNMMTPHEMDDHMKIEGNKGF